MLTFLTKNIPVLFLCWHTVHKTDFPMHACYFFVQTTEGPLSKRNPSDTLPYGSYEIGVSVRVGWRVCCLFTYTPHGTSPPHPPCHYTPVTNIQGLKIYLNTSQVSAATGCFKNRELFHGCEELLPSQN